MVMNIEFLLRNVAVKIIGHNLHVGCCNALANLHHDKLVNKPPPPPTSATSPTSPLNPQMDQNRHMSPFPSYTSSIGLQHQEVQNPDTTPLSPRSISSTYSISPSTTSLQTRANGNMPPSPFPTTSILWKETQSYSC